MFCLKCGNEIRATDPSCPKCSTPNIVPDLNDYMRYTRYLAQVLKLKEIYCPSCGRTVMKITDKYCGSCYSLNPLMVFGDYLLAPSSRTVEALPEHTGQQGGRRTPAREISPAGLGEEPGAEARAPRRGRRISYIPGASTGPPPGSQAAPAARERYAPPAPQWGQPRPPPARPPGSRGRQAPYPPQPGPRWTGGPAPQAPYPPQPTLPVPPRPMSAAAEYEYGVPGAYGGILQRVLEPGYLKALLPRVLGGAGLSVAVGLVLSMLLLGVGVDAGFQQLVNAGPQDAGFLFSSSMTFYFVSHGIGLVPSLPGQPAVAALAYLPLFFIPAVSLLLGGLVTSWLLRTRNVEESIVTGLLMALPYMLLMLLLSLVVSLPIPTVPGLYYHAEPITLVAFTVLWGFMFGGLGGLLKDLAFR